MRGPGAHAGAGGRQAVPNREAARQQCRMARPVFPDVQQVVAWLQGKQVKGAQAGASSSGSGGDGSSCGDDSDTGGIAAGDRQGAVRKQMLRLWAV